MNIYSNPEFLHTAAEAFYPSRSHSIEIADVRGQLFRVLVVDKKVVGSFPFMDFFEGLPAAANLTASCRESYLPRTCQRLITTKEWLEGSFPEGTEASPTVFWEEWPDFQAFAQASSDINSRAFNKRNQKKWQKITQELGASRYDYEVDASMTQALLAQLIEWKSKQYARTGLMNAFANSKTRLFFELLLDKKILHISGLFAGEKALALHAGFVDEGRFYMVLPAYDIQYQQYSPGQLLLEAMMESSHRAGHNEFDFLLGDEEYKFYYANRVRVIAPLGYRFVQDKLWLPVRRRAMLVIRQQQGLYKGLQTLKRKLKERGLL